MIMFGSPENVISPLAFRQRLKGLGYIEAKSILLKMRHVRGREGPLPELRSELVRLREFSMLSR